MSAPSTRLYFPSVAAAAVSPAFDAWDVTAPQMVRRRLVRTKTASAMGYFAHTAVAIVTPRKYGIAQYVSDPLRAQVIPYGLRVTGQVLANEDNASVNMDRLLMSLRVVSNDGAQVIGTLFPLTMYGSQAELPLTPTNQKIADGDLGTAFLAVPDGARLVLELGVENTTNSQIDAFSSLILGDDAASDLPIDTTTTTSLNPWIELGWPLHFQTDAPPEAFENRLQDALAAVLGQIGTPAGAGAWLTAPTVEVGIPAQAVPETGLSEQVYLEHVGTTETGRSESGEPVGTSHELRATFYVHCVSRRTEHERWALNLKADVLRAFWAGEDALELLAVLGVREGPCGVRDDLERAGRTVYSQQLFMDYSATHGTP